MTDKVNRLEKPTHERKISFNSIISSDSINKKRRNAVDYTGRGINLEELLVDASDISDHSDHLEEHKSSVKRKITGSSHKKKSKLIESNSKLDNSDDFSMSRKSTFFYELLFILIDL